MVCYRYILSFVFSVFSFAVFSDEAAEIKALLEDAKNKSQNISFTSVTPISQNGKLQKTVKVYRKSFTDGSVREKGENLFPEGDRVEFYISDRMQTYAVIGNNTFQMRYLPSNRSVIYNSIIGLHDDLATYSVKDSHYGKTPCHEVTISLPETPACNEELTARLSQNPNADILIATRFPFERRYKIDKSNHFIYSCEFFNRSGEKVLSGNWGDVDFETPVDDSIFEIPKKENAIILLPQDKDQSAQIRRVFFVLEEFKPLAKNVKTNELDARTILFEAVRNSRKANFKAVQEVKKNGELKKTVTSYHYFSEDGKVKERSEHIYSDSWQEIYINGGNDTLAILNGTKVKVPFRLGSKRFIYENAGRDIIEDAEYTLEDGKSYNEEKCYLITVRIPMDKEYVKERVARIQQKLEKTEDEILKTLPFVKTFLIGKESKFIYSCTMYNLLGRRTAVEEWGKVVFNPPIQEALFNTELSGVRTVSNQKKYMQIKERCIALFKEQQQTRKKKR